MTYRIYYNNAIDPQRWSVDEGTPETEICVMGVVIQKNVIGQTRTNPIVGEQPQAWVEVFQCEMKLIGGWAHFRSEE